jgi:transposase
MFTGLKKQRELSDTLIEDIVPADHDLVKLKKLLNWEGMNRIYESCYASRRGNATKRTELVIGLLLLKHLYRRADRVLIEELGVNNAFMYFCSVSYEEVRGCNAEGKKVIDHSTLVKVRKRLGSGRIAEIERLFREELIQKGIISGRYLYSDTTSLEDNISYPTEVGLLKRVIEHAEMVVQGVVKKKELVKTGVIRKANQISKVYYSAGKKTKQLLHSTTRQLLSISKDALAKARKSFHRCSEEMKSDLRGSYERVERVGQKIVEQVGQKLSGVKVLDRVVSYYEEDARPLPKGKVHTGCEFGHKLRIDMNGDGYITNYRLYRGNPADVGMLEDVVKEHAERFGKKFKAGAMDRSFYDGLRIEELEECYGIMLAIPHKTDRSKKLTRRKQRLYDRRSGIESKISEGKRMVGLDKSYYRGYEGDVIWSALSILALNIRKLLRDVTRKPKLMKKMALESG